MIVSAEVTPERKYHCDICPSRFRRSDHLRRHVNNSHACLNLTCTFPDCTMVFNGPDQLKRHIRRHEEKNSHSCVLCGRNFGKKRQLESHTLKIHGPFPCQKCGQIFYSRVEFRLHAVDHLQEKHECEYCDSVFFSSSLLRTHKRKFHSSFPCSQCGKSFTRERALRIHSLEKHEGLVSDTVIASRTCGQCGLIFSSVSNLYVHVRCAHDKQRKFRCHHCTKRFAHKHVLQRHVTLMHQDMHEESTSLSDSPTDSPLQDSTTDKLIQADNCIALNLIQTIVS